MHMPQSRAFAPHPLAALLALALVAGLALPAAAQTPEGPQLPAPDAKIGAVHGQIRLGYYATTHTYRYHGDYSAATNLVRAAGSPLYIFGDVDVQALQDSAHGKFQPDRLVGTFEAGAHKLFGAAPLSLFVRHESAHYVERIDRFMGSWDMVGLRFQQPVGATALSVSLADYVHVHQLDSDYRADADVQGVTGFGSVRGHRLELKSDLHAAAGHGGRGSFVDYWIEPCISLSPQTSLFVGYGQIHDTNLSAANTDHPIITGLLFGY